MVEFRFENGSCIELTVKKDVLCRMNGVMNNEVKFFCFEFKNAKEKMIDNNDNMNTQSHLNDFLFTHKITSVQFTYEDRIAVYNVPEHLIDRYQTSDGRIVIKYGNDLYEE